MRRAIQAVVVRIVQAAVHPVLPRQALIWGVDRTAIIKIQSPVLMPMGSVLLRTIVKMLWW